jgi:hypothetical protein
MTAERALSILSYRLIAPMALIWILSVGVRLDEFLVVVNIRLFALLDVWDDVDVEAVLIEREPLLFIGGTGRERRLEACWGITGRLVGSAVDDSKVDPGESPKRLSFSFLLDLCFLISVVVEGKTSTPDTTDIEVSSNRLGRDELPLDDVTP